MYIFEDEINMKIMIFYIITIENRELIVIASQYVEIKPYDENKYCNFINKKT